VNELNYWIEGGVIVVYLVFLLAVGTIFNRLNKNVSDYFRSGAKGTWWLVGSSLFIGAISSATFTATAGVAYDAGLTALMVSVGMWIGQLINILFLARWFRQLRCITFPEVLRNRFSTGVEQMYSLTSMFFQLIFAAITLWSIAVFSGAVFKLNVPLLIFGLGGVVIFYSTFGGRWAVMATDFLKGLILFPMALLMLWLSLKEIGGVSELFARIQEAGLVERYAAVKAYGNPWFGGNQYTWGWVLANMTMGIVMSCSLGASVRYFSCKDGAEAQKSAAWNLILSAVGMTIFIVPPIVARLLYSAQVGAMPISNPQEASYAVACLELLPTGLIGLMVTSMFAACMANIDTGLNANAAVFIQNIYPLLSRTFKLKEKNDAKMLEISRVVTIVFGILIIWLAWIFLNSGMSMFAMMLEVMGMFGLPLVIPVLMAVIFHKGPSWTPYVVIGSSVVPSLVRVLASKGLIPGLDAWNYQTNIAFVLSVGIIAYLVCMLFHERTSPEFKQKVDRFYVNMHTPIDFEKEVGETNDWQQLIMVGGPSSIMGVLVLLLLLIPIFVPATRNAAFFLSVLFVAGFICAVGFGMYFAGRRKMHKTLAEKERQSAD
jgi:Na+/proline symporter